MKKNLRLIFIFGIFIFLSVSVALHFIKSDEKNPAFAIKSAENSVMDHDKEKFYKFVNVDSLINSSYDEVVEGLTDSDKSISIDARDAVKNFTQMLKAPLMLSLKTAIDDYVSTGKLNESADFGVREFLSRTGIDRIEYRGFENISLNPENNKESVADMKIFQPELGGEFIFKVVLNLNDKDEWQIVGVQNFRDFVSQIAEVRREKLENYLSRTNEINSVHDKIIEDAEQKYNSVLDEGSLGNESTRAELKKLMLEIKEDWKIRKQELSNSDVPYDAKTLHNLRIKICDLKISYAAEYADWMSDKKAATIKSAEEKRRQAKTLITEANNLRKRMEN